MVQVDKRERYKVLIWGLGSKYNFYINAIKYCELVGNEIEIIGVTDANIRYFCLDGYPFISLNRISPDNVDYIVVTSENTLSEISVQAKLLGFSEDALILGKVFCIPGFQFGKYRELLHSKISIIANNCWGGLVYHALGLKFLSPFINVSVPEESYFKILGDLKYYLSCTLQLKTFAFRPEMQKEYPICRLDDAELHFIHASSMEDIEEKWYERVKRINWDNLFVMTNTLSKESNEIFGKFMYNKKVCFVPFETEKSYSCILQLTEGNISFAKIVNGIARGVYHNYDLIELLLTGKPNHKRYYIK